MSEAFDDLKRLSGMLANGGITQAEYDKIKADLLAESETPAPPSAPSHPMEGKPAGWYDDPSGNATHQAFWDGAKWTGQTRPRSTTQPPQQSTKKSGVGKWILIGIGVLLAFGLIGSALSGDPVEETFTSIASGLDDSNEDDGVAASPSTAAPTPSQASNTGDWLTVVSYLDDVVDTTDKMATILETVADLSRLAASGEVDFPSYSEVMSTVITSAESHRDHFRGTTPPDGFETTHKHLQNALELYVRAFETAKRGADEVDPGVLSDAAGLMEQGTEQIELAQDALPSIP